MTNKVGSALQGAVNKSCGHPCLQQQGQRSGSHIPKVLLEKNWSLSCCILQPLSLLTHHKVGYRANLSNPSSPGSSWTCMITASPSQRDHGKYQKYNVQNGILAYYFSSVYNVYSTYTFVCFYLLNFHKFKYFYTKWIYKCKTIMLISQDIHWMSPAKLKKMSQQSSILLFEMCTIIHAYCFTYYFQSKSKLYAVYSTSMQ